MEIMKNLFFLVIVLVLAMTMTTTATMAADPEDKPADMQVNVPVTVNQPEEVDVTVKQEEDAPPLRVAPKFEEPVPIQDVSKKSWCARHPGWCAVVIIGATGVATGATLGIIDACGGFNNHVTSNR